MDHSLYSVFWVQIRFMAFDRHMNLVLGDSEEFRKLPPKKGISDDEVRMRGQAKVASCYIQHCGTMLMVRRVWYTVVALLH